MLGAVFTAVREFDEEASKVTLFKDNIDYMEACGNERSFQSTIIYLKTGRYIQVKESMEEIYEKLTNTKLI